MWLTNLSKEVKTKWILVVVVNCCWGARNDAVVRALASHHCGLSSNPGVDAICGLSLSLVLSFAPRGFSTGSPVFPFPQKPTFPNSNSTTLCMCYLQIVIICYYYGNTNVWMPRVKSKSFGWAANRNQPQHRLKFLVPITQ